MIYFEVILFFIVNDDFDYVNSFFLLPHCVLFDLKLKMEMGSAFVLSFHKFPDFVHRNVEYVLFQR